MRLSLSRFTSSVSSRHAFLAFVLSLLLSVSLLTGCAAEVDDSQELANLESQEQVETTAAPDAASDQADDSEAPSASAVSLEEIPAFSGSPYVEINNNIPQFSDEDKARSSFEEYSPLDSLGRCGVAFALIGTETMPTEERGSIGEVRPAGWHTVRYNMVVEGNYLYNRCHLLGYQLSGENANERNLITGTRYLNTEGMLPFENEIADYVDLTGNHVLYRVTPIYDGDNLVASGVQMEAYSVEDNGAGVSFNVYCYNVQPSISIDYATGDSALVGETTLKTTQSVEADYVLNTNSKKFHTPTCSSVDDMKESNKQSYHGTRESLLTQGYDPCGRCNP